MGSAAVRAVAEMKEFATFDASTQRYIRRSLDVAARRDDVMETWARDASEAASIRAQVRLYARLGEIAVLVPDGPDVGASEAMLAPMITVASFDLGQGRLPTFGAFRFLYERLLGVQTRPWLPAAFLAAASMPSIHPDSRRKLLTSVSEAVATAAGWSSKDVTFFPKWVEKIEARAA